MKKPVWALSLLLGLVLWACEQIKTERTKYPNGKLKEEYEITKDDYGQYVKNGMYKSWYDNGKLHHEIHYMDDRKHGLQKTYYRNGQLQTEENYLHGKLSGKKKDWTIDGNVELEVDYMEGKQHGLFIRYREDGSKHHEIEFKNGIKEGYHKTYDNAGKVIETQWYVGGKPSDAPPATEASDDADGGEAAETSANEDAGEPSGGKKAAAAE